MKRRRQQECFIPNAKWEKKGKLLPFSTFFDSLWFFFSIFFFFLLLKNKKTPSSSSFSF
jgi:hypothetical protein